MINDAKGSDGMFSTVGKRSSEKFHILSKKDEIMSGVTKKIKIKDIFNPDENKVNYSIIM
jgi:hypothetical protein